MESHALDTTPCLVLSPENGFSPMVVAWNSQKHEVVSIFGVYGGVLRNVFKIDPKIPTWFEDLVSLFRPNSNGIYSITALCEKTIQKKTVHAVTRKIPIRTQLLTIQSSLGYVEFSTKNFEKFFEDIGYSTMLVVNNPMTYRGIQIPNGTSTRSYRVFKVIVGGIDVRLTQLLDQIEEASRQQVKGSKKRKNN